MTNVNTEYEKLVATIHQGMLNYDGFDNLRVEHNITLIGKSGAKHQIDVFWEFKAAGTTYRTCVECKNYSSSVKKLHVAAFASVLNDIGNANGIIATTSSFQKGALLLAKENNIRLVTVNHLLQSIHLTMNPTQSNIDNLQFQFSRDSIVSALKRNNITELNFNYMINGNDFLLDENNNPVIKIADLIRSHVKNEGENIIENVNL
ncbi:restriction endonuclease, partial [Tolumonas lignilytica]|uniref:restriction endonuclease n=1 Tax=Tolumonas lignilytica TaxID=1283284 RepID=UPI0013780874